MLQFRTKMLTFPPLRVDNKNNLIKNTIFHEILIQTHPKNEKHEIYDMLPND